MEQVSAVGQIKPRPAARHSTLMTLVGGWAGFGGRGGLSQQQQGGVSKQSENSDVSTAVGDFGSVPEFSGFSQ